MKSISVIILNWNGAEMLRRFLPNVIANTDSDLAEVIVADNGSTDDSLQVLANEFPAIKVIELDKNYGFAEGYNRAISEIDSKYVVLLNSDVSPEQGWINPLYDFMETNSDYAACQPKILSVDNPSFFEYAGASGGFLDRNSYPYCRGRIFECIEKDEGQYDDICEIDWASGAALMVRRDIYNKVSGLDEAFFAHMEEIDLCWRMRALGYHIGVVPQSKVYHLGGGSLSANNPHKTYLNFRNNLLLLYKNLPLGERKSKLIKRRLLDTLAWFKFIATFKFQFANSILKAHRDFTKMRVKYADIIPPTENLIEDRPNILKEYYLCRNCKYSRLNSQNSKK